MNTGGTTAIRLCYITKAVYDVFIVMFYDIFPALKESFVTKSQRTQYQNNTTRKDQSGTVNVKKNCKKS